MIQFFFFNKSVAFVKTETSAEKMHDQSVIRNSNLIRQSGFWTQSSNRILYSIYQSEFRLKIKIIELIVITAVIA